MRAQSHKRHSNQRTHGKIKPMQLLTLRAFTKILLALLGIDYAAQIHALQLEEPRWFNQLVRNTLLNSKARAQDLVPTHQLGETAFKCVSI
jgi:hypothetical protein